MSDWGAVNDRVKGVPAGMDLEMPGPGNGNTKKLIAAVKAGEMKEGDLDAAVERILAFVFKYIENRKPDTKFDYEGHHEKARQMAAESMVLLKNDGILPLKKEDKVAFIGKFASEPRFQGGGSSHVNSYKVSGSVEAAKEYGVTYAQGYDTKTDRKSVV